MGKMNKMGRNDLCLCGSGQKYKRCCLKTVYTPPQPTDLLWHRVRKVIEGLPIQLLTFSVEQLGIDAIQDAWDEFTDGQSEPFEIDKPHAPVFMTWFFYDWDCSGTKSEKKTTLAQAYLEHHQAKLDPLWVKYIQQCIIAPFSFFDVMACQPGMGMRLRNIFTGTVLEVIEHSASQTLEVGDILFAKVVQIDQIALLENCAPIAIPPIKKSPILALRQVIQSQYPLLTEQRLKEWDLELLDLYYEIVEELLHPEKPIFQNTDGEDFLHHTLLYDIQSPQAVFDALKHLCITESPEELLLEATFDSSGALLEIEFPWQKKGNKLHSSWSNTILGHISITDKKLTIQVNSVQRAAKFRTLEAKHLRGIADYKTTVVESPEAWLDKEEANEPGYLAQKKRQEEWEALPEVQTHLAEALRAHYQNWIHEKIPVLGNKTPLQAMKTQDGREMVEALLIQIERSGQQMNPSLETSVFKELRSNLGLSCEEKV